MAANRWRAFYPAVVNQSSTRRPGTLPNSRALRVTSVMSRERACAAMNRSWLPMGVPSRSSAATNVRVVLVSRFVERQYRQGTKQLLKGAQPDWSVCPSPCAWRQNDARMPLQCSPVFHRRQTTNCIKVLQRNPDQDFLFDGKGLKCLANNLESYRFIDVSDNALRRPRQTA